MKAEAENLHQHDVVDQHRADEDEEVMVMNRERARSLYYPALAPLKQP